MKAEKDPKVEIESPANVKKRSHQRYEEQAVKVARGMLGYQPAVKSVYSKSASPKFCHKIEFK
ncbi:MULTISPECIES: hypothetical protein [Enterobacteriaceae]|uniref:hypothetical protein n=1 Tax=Enterobacteriaceae TaxID=543 RepID=UPI000F7D8E38|nr:MULTISPECIES: hypothetical protein [Enterobacteriaceae]MDF3828882.1 hypothetical protein [Pseudocitrobacter sp. 2023EL-00150]MEC5374660.1 hypothetical protein [Pseudocitrobacter sp. MW920760]RTD79701.1 hypothetical protein EJ896_03825 [Klebsiella quasipneumoniae subsp. similipneumoniae]